MLMSVTEVTTQDQTYSSTSGCQYLSTSGCQHLAAELTSTYKWMSTGTWLWATKSLSGGRFQPGSGILCAAGAVIMRPAVICRVGKPSRLIWWVGESNERKKMLGKSFDLQHCYPKQIAACLIPAQCYVSFSSVQFTENQSPTGNQQL